MSKLVDELKARLKAISGAKPESDEEQELVNSLAEESEQEAEKETKEKASEAETPGEAILAETASESEFQAFKKQVSASLDLILTHLEAQDKILNDLQEEMPNLVNKSLDNLLAKVRSDKKVPASTNQFSEKNKVNPEADFGKIKDLQKERIKSHNTK